MPSRPPTPCTKPGCADYAVKGGRCEAHQRPARSNWAKWQRDRGSRQDRGYDNQWLKLRRWILARDDRLCQLCLKRGVLTDATQVDHITPKSQGGSNDEGNLQSLCDSCHSRKTAQEGAQGAIASRRPKAQV